MTGPTDPLTPLGEAASSLREMYESLIRAGFTERQALFILGIAVSNGDRGGGEEGS